jgi:molybdopterin converting factor small subunit
MDNHCCYHLCGRSNVVEVPMKITILFFGVAQDLATTRQTTLELKPGCLAGELRSELAKRFPGMDETLAYALAVNERLANDQQVLQDGDIAAVLPPVSGG